MGRDQSARRHDRRLGGLLIRSAASHPHDTPPKRLVALARAAHLPPAVAVTALTAALAVSGDVSGPRTVALTVAALTGQLVVGWTNDLIDRDDDTRVHRVDKPLALGHTTTRAVATAAGVAGMLCVVTSFLCGPIAGGLHLVFGVGSALAYNLGLKSTLLSWLPYLVAFGSLPIVVGAAEDPARFAPVWIVVMAALLGVGAHLLNVFPDLADDAATGVTGLPHRLGARRIPPVAATLLVAATAVGVIATRASVWHWVALAVVVVVAATCTRAPGRGPFYATMIIAGIDVVIVVAA